MSQPKFAPITASLLARKGSAAPSMMVSFADLSARAAEPHPGPRSEAPPVIARAAEPDHDMHAHDHAKKLFVSLSHGEYERLAIAAVKTGLSRHQLVRDALESYFEQLVRDMGEECRCVSGTRCANRCAQS